MNLSLISYCFREKELLSDRETMYHLQLEKEQQYNELLKSLKDRVSFKCVLTVILNNILNLKYCCGVGSSANRLVPSAIFEWNNLFVFNGQQV
jgi:hypothetical protein